MKKSGISGRTTKLLFGLVPLVILVVAGAASPQGKAPPHGVVVPLASAKLTSDGQPACLKTALENGDPHTGPSTFIGEAAPGCVVAAHSHTAEEQLMVVRGDVLTGMDGVPERTLGPGGFAMMPSKVMHWFSCRSTSPCLLFITFDRKFDIVWAKQTK